MLSQFRVLSKAPRGRRSSHACPMRTWGACDHVRVIVRPQEPRDYEAAKVVYAEAFKRQDHGDRAPPEVGIFVALWEAKDVIDELSFTALAQNAVVGHVTASRAEVGSTPWPQWVRSASFP